MSLSKEGKRLGVVPCIKLEDIRGRAKLNVKENVMLTKDAPIYGADNNQGNVSCSVHAMASQKHM